MGVDVAKDESSATACIARRLPDGSLYVEEFVTVTRADDQPLPAPPTSQQGDG